jgi:hypothetical protein
VGVMAVGESLILVIVVAAVIVALMDRGDNNE